MLLCIHLTTLPFRYHHLPDYKVMGNLCRRLVGVLVLLTVFTENAITQLYGQGKKKMTYVFFLFFNCCLCLDAVHSNLLNGKTLRVASVEVI